MQGIRHYYNILYLLVSAIVRNEPTLVCGDLYSSKQYLNDYQLKLSDFIYNRDVFHGMEIYYTATVPHNGAFQSWAFHCEGGNHPKEKGIITTLSM